MQDFILNLHFLTMHPSDWAWVISGFQCQILWHLSVQLICTIQHSHLRKSPNQNLFVPGTFIFCYQREKNSFRPLSSCNLLYRPYLSDIN